MFNKRLLIILTLLFSILLIVSAVSAEEIDNDIISDEDTNDLNQDFSLTEDVIGENDDNGNLEDNENILQDCGISDSNEIKKSVSKNQLSSSILTSGSNSVHIDDVTAYDNEEIYISITTEYTGSNYVGYTLDIDDNEGVNVFSIYDFTDVGKHTVKIHVGNLAAGSYNVYYYDDDGLDFTSKLTVKKSNAAGATTVAKTVVTQKSTLIKIKVPNYSSYYKSGKKLTVKTLNKSNNKGVSVKLKFVYKKPKAKSKVYYVTTNSKGIAKVKIPVGIGKYKLTVSSANSRFKAGKVYSKVNVKKYVVFKAGKYRGKLTYKQVLALKRAKKNNKDLWINVKTGKYYTYKKPIYKTVYVKKSRWDYKYRLASEDWWDDYGSDWETYNPKTPKGYTWCGTVYKSGNGWSKTYYKYKKKVSYWDTKEVKTGKYKKVKDKIYMTVSTNSGKGQYGKCDLIEVWSSGYWDTHEENIITKNIKL